MTATHSRLTVGPCYRPHPDVAAEMVGDSLILVHLGNGSAYRLNRTGMTVWRLIGESLPLGEIAQRMQTAFGVPFEKVEQDVRVLLEDLVRNSLLVPVPREGA